MKEYIVSSFLSVASQLMLQIHHIQLVARQPEGKFLNQSASCATAGHPTGFISQKNINR